jgi:hypothetical protein
MVIAGNGKIGELESKRRQSTGTVSTIIRIEQGRFRLICDEHGYTVERHSYGVAISTGSHPEQFCPECREAAGLPPRIDPAFSEAANPNAGVCDGCGEHKPSLCTMRHLDVDHSMRLCTECIKPGAHGRKRWDKRVARAALARKANHQGLTKAERRRMRKRINERTGAAAGKRAKGGVALLDEEDDDG